MAHDGTDAPIYDTLVAEHGDVPAEARRAAEEARRSTDQAMRGGDVLTWG